MRVFGKKCPACEGHNLISRPAVGRLASIPTAHTYACADCHQPLVYLLGFSIAIENRQSIRKRMPPFFLIRINGADNQYARINNISEGGLSFCQQYNAAPFSGPHLFLDLFNCNDGSSLELLPAEIVATNEQLQEHNGHKATTINYSLRFKNLSQAQRKVLSNCLHQYGLS
ncbi:PilZ domain-containing protein [Desulfobulbus propionicus]